MWPIFKKELRENWAYAAAVFAGVLLLLDIFAEEQGWYPLATGGKAVPVWSNRLSTPLPIFACATLCVWLAALIAIKIVYEEHWRRTWPVLAQLPVSRERIVFAKFLAGLAIYSAITAVSAGLMIVRLAVPGPGAWPGPFLFGDCWALAIPWIGGLCVYCLAFLSAHRHARWYATKWLPLAPAMFVWDWSTWASGAYVRFHSLARVLEYGRPSGTLLMPAAGLLVATALAIFGVRDQARTREY
jgi:ABC-type Na+ efflux pump permease subunit